MTARPAAELRVDISPDGLAVPRDMGAGYGDGLSVGLCLGGGGLWFVAWQVTYLYELLQAGVDLRGADRVVGTPPGRSSARSSRPAG
jgi:hypothetical protein